LGHLTAQNSGAGPSGKVAITSSVLASITVASLPLWLIVNTRLVLGLVTNGVGILSGIRLTSLGQRLEVEGDRGILASTSTGSAIFHGCSFVRQLGAYDILDHPHAGMPGLGPTGANYKSTERTDQCHKQKNSVF
jgi:hypothetical protein